MPTATNAELLDLLATGELEIEGRLVDASNVVLRVWLTKGERRIAAVHKPIRGERPLWDFPQDSLAGREWSAYLVSCAGGWDVVPPTVLREGPFGLGSVQLWVGPLEPGDSEDLLRIDPPGGEPDDFLPVMAADDEDGDTFVVSHSSAPEVRSLAVFDALVNNADRKGSAMILDEDRLWAIDHGLCFHDEDKLRTVLWGFAGDELTLVDRDRLVKVRDAVDADLGIQLRAVLADAEVAALRTRAQQLLEIGRMPDVPLGRYPLPWPLW